MTKSLVHTLLSDMDWRRGTNEIWCKLSCMRKNSNAITGDVWCATKGNTSTFYQRGCKLVLWGIARTNGLWCPTRDVTGVSEKVNYYFSSHWGSLVQHSGGS
jgi:hypothetical protein